jgi:hypothetical protein
MMNPRLVVRASTLQKKCKFLHDRCSGLWDSDAAIAKAMGLTALQRLPQHLTTPTIRTFTTRLAIHYYYCIFDT